MNTDNPCPNCGATDLGDVIPPEINRNESYGPQGTRARRHIALYDVGRDKTVAWVCCKCWHQWDRA